MRIHPLIAGLTESARTSDFDNLTGFAPGLQHRLAGSLARIAVERQALARARATRARLDARRTALAVNPDWPPFEDRINDGNDKAVVVRKARQSLPNRRRELADSEAQLQTLRSLIGLAPATPLEPILPSPVQLDAVQRLAKDALERRASVDAHTKTHDDLADEIAGLQEAVDRARMAGRDQPFGVNDADLAAFARCRRARNRAGRTPCQGGSRS
ncbi:MAG: hypothetical protein IPG56_10305 [Caulobacteraceae bacterium]|nr:hypothetical protein [Caulobacteraceae bacterium]